MRRYEEASASQRNQIKALLGAIWAEQDSQDVHSPFFKVMSFCAYSGECLVGYAAVLSWPLRVGHTVFNACGLSCVCTHPEYQNKGIGRNGITETTRWIIESKLFDFGLFTCTMSLTRFYDKQEYGKKIGFDTEWQAMDGSLLQAPMRSKKICEGRSGSKLHLHVDGQGISLGLVVVGGNVHDSRLISQTLENSAYSSV